MKTRALALTLPALLALLALPALAATIPIAPIIPPPKPSPMRPPQVSLEYQGGVLRIEITSYAPEYVTAIIIKGYRHLPVGEPVFTLTKTFYNIAWVALPGELLHYTAIFNNVPPVKYIVVTVYTLHHVYTYLFTL